jgi:hypothetical protein
MILVTADITGLERRRTAIREAHRAKREFGRVVSEELPRALLYETKFRESKVPTKGIRAALDGGRGAIRETDETARGVEVRVGIRYADVPWWRIQDRGGIIRAKNVRNLTIPLTDEAAMELYKAGGARNIPDLDFAKIGGLPYLVKESNPDVPYIRLKPSVVIKAKPYVSPGVERFRRTAWKRLAATLPGMMVNP